MANTKSDAFDLKDGQFKGRWEDRDDFCQWLCNELDLALGARGGAEQEIRLAWDYYEQARMRGSNAPWPDAADLPSPYAPEYTDALHARLMQTIFVEPVWTVEGWGASAVKAPFVEEFHQRAQEDERLQGFADEWVLRGLVEGVGTLEVSEAYEMRRERVQKRVKLQQDETGAPILGEDNQPLLQQDETGQLTEADPGDQQTPSALVDVDQDAPIRLGPDYDVIPYVDFLTLPAHARNRKQVWGHAKRFHRRVPELETLAEKGIYDADAVTAIGPDNDKTASNEAPTPTAVVSQDGPTAQKELFEVQLLADVDGKGERWWRVTVHKDRKQLLRLKVDDRSTRYIRWYPFPKPGTMDRGYSLLVHKLITVLEEDTAVRNMTADRMAMVAGQPVKRLQGALWDPFEQPWGPRAVIDVRDMREVEPVAGVPDMSPSLFNWRGSVRADADRLIGQNDVSLGIDTEGGKPTATQVSATASYAEVRVNVLMKRLAEPMEELFQARHAIWKRTLASNPHLPPQRALVIGRDVPGIDTEGIISDNTITADMLEGIYWGKPRGSVETADLGRQRADFNSLLQTLPALMMVNPAVKMVFSTIPAAKALIEQALKLNRIQDRQSFLGSNAHDVFAVMQEHQDQQAQMQQVMSNPVMQLLHAALGGGQPGQLPAGQPQPPQGGVQQAPAPAGAAEPSANQAPMPQGLM